MKGVYSVLHRDCLFPILGQAGLSDKFQTDDSKQIINYVSILYYYHYNFILFISIKFSFFLFQISYKQNYFIDRYIVFNCCSMVYFYNVDKKQQFNRYINVLRKESSPPPPTPLKRKRTIPKLIKCNQYFCCKFHCTKIEP